MFEYDNSGDRNEFKDESFAVARKPEILPISQRAGKTDQDVTEILADLTLYADESSLCVEDDFDAEFTDSDDDIMAALAAAKRLGIVIEVPSEMCQESEHPARQVSFDLRTSSEATAERAIIPDRPKKISVPTYDSSTLNQAGVRFKVLSEGNPVNIESLKISNERSSFLHLFTNRFASLVKRGRKADWKKTSQFHFLTDEEILTSIKGSTEFTRAIQADVKTQIAAITLDADSYYKTKEGLTKLRECLRSIELGELKLYMMADSGERQLMIFFRKPVSSSRLSRLLSSWLRRNGIVPGTAGVDIFPGSKALRIPLQPGFSWINDDGQIIASRDEISLEAALALFFADFERTAADGEELINRLDHIVKLDHLVKKD